MSDQTGTQPAVVLQRDFAGREIGHHSHSHLLVADSEVELDAVVDTG